MGFGPKEDQEHVQTLMHMAAIIAAGFVARPNGALDESYIAQKACKIAIEIGDICAKTTK